MNSEYERIFLVGFMAAGKTTIGRLLAKKIGYDFADTDEILENETKLKISEIFEQHGESYFRKLEANLLKKLILKDKLVIATGGGMPCFGKNMEVMSKYGCSIFVQSNFKSILQRIKKTRNRPIANTKSEKELYLLYKDRLVFYKEARFRIYASRAKEKVIQRIVTLINNKKQ